MHCHRNSGGWPWASTRAHLSGRENGITDLEPVRERFPDVAELLEEPQDGALFELLRKAETIRRPPGDEAFMERIARARGRDSRPGKRGPKPRRERDER